jgi:hypothetical protein
MPDADAIDVALRLTREPGGQRRIGRAALPTNMMELLKIVTEDPETTARISHSRGVAPSVLRDSARFAMQKIILESGADHYRALGLSAGATAIQLRDHKRLLLKWLHPDRNHNSWEAALFLRVQEAVEKLESGATTVTLSEQSKDSRRGKGSRDERNRGKVQGFRPEASRRQIFMRNAGIPALTIAAAAAGIYVASVYGLSSATAREQFLSLLQWQKP